MAAEVVHCYSPLAGQSGGLFGGSLKTEFDKMDNYQAIEELSRFPLPLHFSGTKKPLHTRRFCEQPIALRESLERDEIWLNR